MSSTTAPTPTVRTFLWFDGQAAEAARLYTSLVPGSRILGDLPAEGGPAVMTVDFELAGQRFTALNGGPHFKFNEAISIAVSVEGQAEVDRLWGALTADGGSESRCGWLKDKYGLSWQIIPTALPRLLGHPDRVKAASVLQAMMGMKKLDVAALEAAAR